MTTLRSIATLSFAIGLWAGSALVATAQSPAPVQAVLVTGELVPSPGEDFTEDSETDGVVRQRGRVTPGRLEMSDPRLSGDVVTIDNADRFNVDSEEAFADVLWGTIEIVNDGGSWTGTSVGTSDRSADGAGITYFELVGSGDYDGLSAVLFQPEIFDPVAERGEFPMNGVIFPGELPPDR